MSSEYQLATEITKLSDADQWDEAKLEWQLKEIYREDEPLTCLCGHFPIIEICVLSNSKNGNEALVGNICVKKFLGLPSNKIFTAIKRITDDESAALNPEAIIHVYERGWIDEWKKKFYLDTWRKRNLSNKQLAKRIGINQMVLRRITNRFRQRSKMST